jgi:hypothetical protein
MEEYIKLKVRVVVVVVPILVRVHLREHNVVLANHMELAIVNPLVPAVNVALILQAVLTNTQMAAPQAHVLPETEPEVVAEILSPPHLHPHHLAVETAPATPAKTPATATQLMEVTAPAPAIPATQVAMSPFPLQQSTWRLTTIRSTLLLM